MKQILTYSLMIALIGLIIGCAPQTENPQDLLKAAEALDKQFVEAYNNGDVDGLMATYWNSPDLVVYPPDHMEVRGWDANRETTVETFAKMRGATLELLESNNKVVGSVVLGSGKWRVTLPMPETDPMIIEGRYTDVKTRMDGKMVYIVDHASVPLPPPPGSPEM